MTFDVGGGRLMKSPQLVNRLRKNSKAPSELCLPLHTAQVCCLGFASAICVCPASTDLASGTADQLGPSQKDSNSLPVPDRHTRTKKDASELIRAPTEMDLPIPQPSCDFIWP